MENFAQTRDKVHASKMHLLNCNRPIAFKYSDTPSCPTVLQSNRSASGQGFVLNRCSQFITPFGMQQDPDYDISALKVHQSEVRTTIMPHRAPKMHALNSQVPKTTKGKAKMFFDSTPFDKQERPSTRSIELAVKCAQLEGMLKLSCCRVVKRLEFNDFTQMKKALQQMKANTKAPKMIEYESFATSFGVSMSTFNQAIAQTSLLRDVND